MPFLIHLHASAIDAGRMRVTATTNLPNRALVYVTVSRAFKNRGEKDVRAVEAGRKNVTVTNGRISVLIRVDEKTLLVGVPDLGRIATVDNALTACADFPTGRDIDGKQYQPNPRVRRIVGPRGEHLKGSPQAFVFGSLTPTPSHWLEASARVVVQSPLISRIAGLQGSVPTSSPLSGFCLY
jgi:hypothetical protein